GTNDLIQYLLAVDRGNPALGEMFSPLYPAVIRVLHQVIQTCKAAGKPVSICGEIASDARFTRMLLALGLTEFSMHPSSLLDIRATIRDSDLRQLRRRTGALLRAGRRTTLEQLVARL
ncbi:MAG: phosphoenolpyruvate--protein phosphotransferase, partial [Xanthomonadales bacterium]|nr:phosphoenolpyruvate--protein phosphotransferase [Xanthomonadales bacterium]